jgi:hypothetical protein
MCAIAGGNWNNGANTGVWALNLNNNRTNSNNNIGFRSDSVKPRNLMYRYGGAKGDTFRCVAIAMAKSVYLHFSGSNNPVNFALGRERQMKVLF